MYSFSLPILLIDFRVFYPLPIVLQFRVQLYQEIGKQLLALRNSLEIDPTQTLMERIATVSTVTNS